jgi:UDP-2-acetamido-3-amino-2,3-dideoxy-glucuronate N-acetyltransferase
MNLSVSIPSVGAFVEISPEAIFGAGCSVGSFCSIEAGVVVGEDVVIESGVAIPSGVIVEAGVRIEANVAFVRSGPLSGGKGTILRKGCRIGANATIGSGVTVGEGAVIGPGAVVLTSVQPHAVVSGRPAKVIAFSGTAASGVPPQGEGDKRGQQGEFTSRVHGVRLFELPFVHDPRGNLTVGEFERTIPFRPLRYFITFDVPNERVRGEHAHRQCEQFLVCVRGACSVVVDDGRVREEHRLDRPTVGIYVPPMVWATEYKHTPDSTLMVFASHYYDPTDYVRDYQEFLRLITDEAT